MFKPTLQLARFFIGIYLASLSVVSVASDISQSSGFNFVDLHSTSNEPNKIFFVVNGHAFCIDAQTGTSIWSIKAPGLESQEGPGVGPVLTNSNLIYMAGGGFFTAYGLDQKTGNTKWTLDSRSPALASGANTVFLSTQGGLGVIAVDGDSGKIKWSHSAVDIGGTLKRIVYSQGHLYTNSAYIWDANTGKIISKFPFNPRVLNGNNKSIFLTASDMPLIAVDASTNKVLWRAENPVVIGADKSADQYLASSEKYVVATFYDDIGHVANHGVVNTYNAANGELLWKLVLTSKSGLDNDLVSVDEKNVYIIEPNAEDKGSKISAYDAQSGKLLWRYTNAAISIIGPMASLNSTVLVYGYEPKLGREVLFALEKANGKERWKFESIKSE